MKDLKIMVEYKCSPIWIRKSSEDIFENVSIDSLDCSSMVKRKAEKWNNAFQNTFNSNYPPDSGFKTKKEVDEFNKEGIEIWLLLVNELHMDYTVAYRQYEGPLIYLAMNQESSSW